MQKPFPHSCPLSRRSRCPNMGLLKNLQQCSESRKGTNSFNLYFSFFPRLHPWPVTHSTPPHLASPIRCLYSSRRLPVRSGQLISLRSGTIPFDVVMYWDLCLSKPFFQYTNTTIKYINILVQ